MRRVTEPVVSRTPSNTLMAAIFVVCALVNALLAWPAIRQLAPTYDEPVHLAAGYVYLKTGDYRMNGYHHPPLSEMWCAIPLLFLNPEPLVPMAHPAWATQTWRAAEQYGFADTFLYHNRVGFESMMTAGRCMQWVLQLLLGVLIVMVAWRLMNRKAACLVAGAWTFSPVFLAHGTQITTDLAFTTFYFAFFAALTVAPLKWRGVLAGVALGLCFASKFFAIAVLPALGAIVLWETFIEKKKIAWSTLLPILPVALIVVAAVYRFHDVGVFWKGLGDLISRAEAGRSSYFLGQHGTDGWLLYFPVVLLVKTPLGQLIASIAGFVWFARHKKWPAALWIAPAVFFAISCFSNVQIGHRYILACYPFLLLFVGGLAATNVSMVFGVTLLAWQAGATLWVRPHYLSYFNEVLGGSSQGYRYLTDSNVDWGQALSLVPAALTPAEKQNGIFLSYFGTADPHSYGLRYIDIGSTGVVRRMDDADQNIQPTTFVISATNLQSTYYGDKHVFDWLKELTPRAVLGYGLFVYDLSAYPDKVALLRRLRS